MKICFDAVRRFSLQTMMRREWSWNAVRKASMAAPEHAIASGGNNTKLTVAVTIWQFIVCLFLYVCDSSKLTVLNIGTGNKPLNPPVTKDGFPSQSTFALVLYWTNSQIVDDLRIHGGDFKLTVMSQRDTLNDHYIRTRKLSGNVNAVNFDEIFIVVKTKDCHFDNFQGSQWRQFLPIFDISVSLIWNGHLRHISFSSRLLH